jgi:hypothetical protein
MTQQWATANSNIILYGANLAVARTVSDVEQSGFAGNAGPGPDTVAPPRSPVAPAGTNN